MKTINKFLLKGFIVSNNLVYRNLSPLITREFLEGMYYFNYEQLIEYKFYDSIEHINKIFHADSFLDIDYE
jgi:hypothetical protein